MEDNNKQLIDSKKLISESMINKPIINIGCIGHVADGKSTLVRQLTGVATQKHTREKKLGITWKLGYANAKIFKCPSCDAPECYQSCSSDVAEYLCSHCQKQCELMRHVSFVDAPGHNTLMQVMLNGACVMDYTILVESVENALSNASNFPAPQTKDHMMITQLSDIPTYIVCLNKLDLVKKPKAVSLLTTLQDYLTANNTTAPIIPISASLGHNIDVVCEYLANIPIPDKDLNSPFKMMIIRSFNVNTSGTSISDLKGGIIGGSLTRGILRPNDDVIIYPGYIFATGNDKKNRWTYKPLHAKALSINSDKTQLDYAISGGLIGVQLDIDPALSGNDGLVGHIIVPNNQDAISKIKVFESIIVKYTEIVNENESETTEENMIKKGSVLSLNINANNRDGTLIKIKKDVLHFELDKPICVEIGDKITISIKNQKGDDFTIQIISYGEIIDGIESSLK